MRAIYRKLWRELWHQRWQSLAIGMVMVCGVAIVVMFLSTLDSLSETRAAYYDRNGFADVFAHLKRAPLAMADRLADIPGVARVEPRVAVSVTLDVEGMPEPATGMIISVPDFRPPSLNRLHLRAGRWIEPGRPGEALVSESFAEAHDLKPGDKVNAIINGRLQSLRLVGIVLSPEYIYSVRPGELIPDDKRFGVFWMSYTELATAFDMDGAFNDVVLKLARRASEEEVIRRVDRLLTPYGCQGAYGRDDQPSYHFLENEMQQLRTMAYVPSTIFIGVTTFLLQVVMSRMVATEREQIATLRAFGYSRFEVALHYLQFAAVIILFGALGGVILGAWMGRGLTQLYTQFFHFPEFNYRLELRVVVLAVGAGSLATIAGSLLTVWRAASEPPARAMQPEAPPRYRATIVERLGLTALVSPAARMILRHLERQPVRSGLSTLGISLAIAVLIMGNFSADTVDFILDVQFSQAQRQSITVTFVEPTSGQAIYDLRHLPGVMHVEPFRSVPVRLRHGPRSRRLAIMGLPSRPQLYRPVDAERRPIDMPDEGLVVSRALAERLGCRAGDLVQVEVLEGERPVRQVPIVALVDDLLDLNAYMEISSLQRLMQEQDAVSGAFLMVDRPQVDRLYAELKETPRIAGVMIKEATVASLQRTMAENLLRMRAINVMFATVIAFGVVYNTARIALAERSRELATLRVLGFTRRETSFILLGEMAVLVALAIPLGMGIGYALASALVAQLATEVFRFPLVIRPTTYAMATTVTLVAALASALIVRRRIDHFDLVAVLKARD